jgi:hypothetical protein
LDDLHEYGILIYDPAGYSLDAFYLSLPSWTDDDEQKAQEARRLFGVMSQPKVGRVLIDEFPKKK